MRRQILRKIIIKLAMAALISTALTALVWFAPGDYHHDLAALVNKRDLLVSTPPPRLIFIGGSNLTTMRSGIIEKSINRNSVVDRSIVNLGLWGGLSIGRYLDEIFPYLREGDSVIICQEYATLLDRNYFTYIRENRESQPYFFLMQPGKGVREHLSEGRLPDLARIIFMLNQIKMKTYLSIILEANCGHRSTGGFYHYASHYNDYGDRVRPFSVIRPLNGSGALFGKPNPDDLVYLKGFNQRARMKGVRVVIAFPPFPEPDYRLNRAAIGSLETLLREGFGLELLNKPLNSVYPKACFADSVNHLTPECEIRRSAMMINALSTRVP